MKSLCLTFALGLGCSAAIAADADLLRCLAIADSPARLACYDALASAVRDAKPAPALAAPAPAAITPPVLSSAENFGRPAVAPLPVNTVLESRVDGRIDGWHQDSRIRLVNGQVWQVGDSTASFAALDSPKVTLRPGMLGSYFLEVEGLSFQVRVKRVQ